MLITVHFAHDQLISTNLQSLTDTAITDIAMQLLRTEPTAF